MSDGNFGLPYKNFLGYTKDKSGVLQVVEEEAAIVREIYRLYMQGFSYASIAKKLTADGILTPTRKEVWTTATVRNILKNETYRGSKYLQKQYVTDYLTKSKKRNEGELMSWYVEKSHTPIIPPEEWDMVQAEILRRRSLKRPITCHSPFATRVVCGECGGFFGSKVWNSTSPQHRRIVWQCNNRYVKGGGGRQCETPHVTEKKLSDGFVAAFNELLAEREDFIKDCLALRDKLADMNEVDAELAELERELDICEELTRKAIAENASRVLDQDEWNARNDAYLARYNAAKERIAELEQTKTMRQYEGKTVDGFVKKLRAHAKAIAEFDVDLWAAVIDRVVVDEDGGLTYVFKGGTAIKA
ncbi:MAG: recombinase family protein [Oscillospiraceae bacterium]|nr:recombinase family protein [Oscillospiraceae bacterium]